MKEIRVGFIGFGHMAKILFSAVDKAKLIPHSQILFCRRDPAKSKKTEQECKITATSLENLIDRSQVIFICVRPNQVEKILQEHAEALSNKQIISILAGVKISYFQKVLGPHVQVIRAMPNLSSSVFEGMTVLSSSSTCEGEFKNFTHLFFGAIGKVLNFPESLMDVSCAMAGSGPGFVFRLIEVMAKTGVKHGMNQSDALQMAAQVFYGASKLILEGEDPGNLIVQISTPNGTTEAGLNKMGETLLDLHFQQAIEASLFRSQELSNSL